MPKSDIAFIAHGNTEEELQSNADAGALLASHELQRFALAHLCPEHGPACLMGGLESSDHGDGRMLIQWSYCCHKFEAAHAKAYVERQLESKGFTIVREGVETQGDDVFPELRDLPKDDTEA